MNQPTPNEQTCPSPLRDDLKAYLDDELTPSARRLVQSHLRTCADCAKEVLMLQTTQTQLRGELHEQAPPIELHHRILTQIEASGIHDEHLRRNRARSGLIPRRYLPLAIALSTLITAVALFPMVAHLREKARQADAIANGRQIGLAFTQYAQDYDEKFPTGTWMSNGKPIPVQPGASVPTREVTLTLQVKQPKTAFDTIATWEWSVEASPTGDTEPITLTIFANAAEINRLLPKLQKLGKINARQVHLARVLATAHPSDEAEVIVQIVPEKMR